MVPSGSADTADRRGIARVLGPVIDRQTYKNVAYLLLAFPLGMVYFTVLMFGFAFGLALSVVGVGLVILVGTIVVARGLAKMEGQMATSLLAVDIASIPDLESSPRLRGKVRAYVDDGYTWRGLGYLTLKFWQGVSGIILLFAFVTAGSMIATIASRPRDVEFLEVNGEPVVWTVTTLPEAILATGVGLVAVVALLHLANALAYVAGRSAVALLGAAGGADAPE